jgi:hypothetical protein
MVSLVNIHKGLCRKKEKFCIMWRLGVVFGIQGGNYTDHVNKQNLVSSCKDVITAAIGGVHADGRLRWHHAC